MKPYYRYEGRVCIKKEEGISVVERRKRRSIRVHREVVEEGIH